MGWEVDIEVGGGGVNIHHLFCNVCLDLADCDIAFYLQKQRFRVLGWAPVDVAFVLQLANEVGLLVEASEKALSPLHFCHSQAVYNNPRLPSR